ncbi:MAG: phage tail protein [Bacteroidales bacterium]
MALLTEKAITGYVEYTKRTLAYVKYKVGAQYYKTEIIRIAVQNKNQIVVEFMIDHTVNGDIVITEVQLYDDNNDIWLKKAESISRKQMVEGILYRITITISEG